MSNAKVVMGQAANTLVKPLNVEDVFSTYLYEGTSSTQTITNGIDLAGEGGLIWTKQRNIDPNNHMLVDTERGLNKWLESNTTDAEGTHQNITSVSSTGYVIPGNTNAINNDAYNFTSWTFRKAPKFFDVVTYTGTGTDQLIPHNLGCVPGFVVVKKTSAAGYWSAWHRSFTNNEYILLNLTNAAVSTSNVRTVTDTHYEVHGGYSDENQSGETYVAYLFAHNDGNGGFGADGDADIIKCGSFTSDGSGLATVDVGFEPQWVLYKGSTAATHWSIADSMRGFVADTASASGKYLNANSNSAELSNAPVGLTNTGFKYNSAPNIGFIYIAIRRGTKVPESATEVFAVDQDDGVGSPAFISGFPVDFNFYRNVNSAQGAFLSSRLTGNKYMQSTSTAAESSSAGFTWDYMDGFRTGPLTTDFYSWMWKRAPNFFDVVAYTGNGVAGRTVSHNLGVAPEMMWVRKRNAAGLWRVYHKGLNGGTNPEQYGINLNETSAEYDLNTLWNDTAPTASVFSLGTQGNVNGSSSTYIAYLFASLPGISKVGSYTGSNSVAVEVDCGFTSGARFVLIKRTDAVGTSGNWYVYDSVRGILSSADDPYLLLNTTDAEDPNTNNIEPLSSGFKLTIQGNNPISVDGGSYIFYAIA